MRSALWLPVLVLVSACAGRPPPAEAVPDADPGAGPVEASFSRPEPDPELASAPSTHPSADDDWSHVLRALAEGKRSAEARLRDEVAQGPRGAEAAEVLARWLAAPRQERVADALAVVDAYIQRVAPDPAPVSLRAWRGELLRDLGAVDRAVYELAALAKDSPSDLEPIHWLSLAELHELTGDRDAALTALGRAEGAWSGSAEWTALAAPVAELRASPDRGVLARDLMGALRGHDDDVVRMEALATLVGVGGDVAFAAVALALDDRDGDVRALAIRALPEGAQGREAVVRVALSDRDREVRMAAADAARLLPGAQRRSLVTAALARESDPVVADALRRCLEFVPDGEPGKTPETP